MIEFSIKYPTDGHQAFLYIKKLEHKGYFVDYALIVLSKNNL